MQKIITTLKGILTPLCKLQKDVWPNENWEHIYVDWPPLAREDLEALFGQSETGEVDSSKSTRGKVIYLPPLEKGSRLRTNFIFVFQVKRNSKYRKTESLVSLS